MVILVIERDESLDRRHFSVKQLMKGEEARLVNLVRDDENQIHVYTELIKKSFKNL